MSLHQYGPGEKKRANKIKKLLDKIYLLFEFEKNILTNIQ